VVRGFSPPSQLALLIYIVNTILLIACLYLGADERTMLVIATSMLSALLILILIEVHAICKLVEWKVRD